MKALLAQLTGIYGPSGKEETVRQAIQQEIRDYVDEIHEDIMGNLIAVKSSSLSGKKIMLAAHMDQIGLIVTNIDENGFLRFSNIGGVSPFNVMHRRVVFQNGVTGAVSFETELEDIKKLRLNKMYIDIGAASREQAKKLVQIGDVAVYHGPMAESGDRYFGCAMDDRAGCAVLIETVKTIKDSPNELVFVFTVQEEVGLRGARTSSYAINPDIGISVDVTLTGIHPNQAYGSESGRRSGGEGEGCFADLSSPGEKPDDSKGGGRHTLSTGGIGSRGYRFGSHSPFQEGVPSGVISIPCRYVHSAHEMVDKNDLENAVRLLTRILENEIHIPGL